MAPPSVGNSQESGGRSAAFGLTGFGLGLGAASTSSAFGLAANSVALASARTLRRGSIRRQRRRDGRARLLPRTRDRKARLGRRGALVTRVRGDSSNTPAFGGFTPQVSPPQAIRRSEFVDHGRESPGPGRLAELGPLTL
eukprot:scaffold88615_cov59-Phaeocystis_antarctica.AAC.3